MKSFKKFLITSTSLLFSIGILVQCTSSDSNTTGTTQVQTTSTQNENSEYVNLYDGRAAFPDSVHKSWQDGKLEDVRKSVLTYIDGMITGVENEVAKYKEAKDTEKLKIAEEKLERVKDLKVKIENAKDKEEINDLMHKEFKSGKYKDKFGTGK